MSAPGRDGLRILLVEDDSDHVELIRHALEGKQLVAALERVSDGVEGLKYLRALAPYENRMEPDLVLLDLKLPRKDGLEVLREVKADPALCHIPIVVLTTSAAEADITAAYREHVNSYLVKPVDYRRFEALLEQLGHYWGEYNRRPPAPDEE